MQFADFELLLGDGVCLPGGCSFSADVVLDRALHVLIENGAEGGSEEY